MRRATDFLTHLAGRAGVLLAVGLMAAGAHAAADGGGDFTHRLARRFDSRLGTVERRLDEIAGAMAPLPVLPDMDALGTHGFHSDFTLESENNWFEITWPTPQGIDGIALVPTRLTTQSGEMSNYGFPNKLRVLAVPEAGGEPVVLAELGDTHLDFRRGDPVFFEFPPTTVRSLRFIPVDSPTLPGKPVRFFSVSELMVFRGDENIAPAGQLAAPYSIDAEVGWNLGYLVDGQSPLGPPEVPPAGLSLGWHADIAATGESPTWAEIDLGAERRIESCRLIAARGDSPVKGPGFGFPVRFRLEVRADDAGAEWRTVWGTGGTDYPNPGYNPVTLRFPPVNARWVKLVITAQHQPDPLTAPRILLSEIEVLDGTGNVALGKPVRTPDALASRPHDGRRVWSSASLTDGFSSTGRLVPKRHWAAALSRRFELALEQRSLLAERERILTRTHQRVLAGAFSLLAVVIIGMAIWQVRLRLAGRRRIHELRRRISGDLHDEVGSNLATIALLAELAPADGPGQIQGDISRLARESSQSLREIVDLTLAPNRARKPLPDRLREVAALMLRDHEWTFAGDGAPNLDPEQRRNLLFFFKESLHNVSSHAKARRVAISLTTDAATVTLAVADDGRGLPESAATGQPRLRALEQRAASLHGSLTIDSAPGAGTALTLRFPLHPPPPP